jgi:WD40 repeat protein
MRHCLNVLLLAALLLTPVLVGAPVRPTAGRADGAGDPLPPQALLRVGTVRLRHGNAVTALAVAADGKTVVSAGRDETLRVWDLATGKEVRHWQRDDNSGSTFSVYALALSSDGQRLAAASNATGRVTVWDPATGQPLRTLDAAIGPQAFVGFLDAGDTLLLQRDRTCQVFDVNTGTERGSFKLENPDETVRRKEKEGPHCLALSPDASLLLTAQAGGSVRAWDVAEGVEAYAIEGDGDPVSAAAVSPGNRLYAWATTRGQLHVNKASGDELYHLAPDGNYSIDALTFSPDGKQIACGGGGVLCILAADSGREIHRIDAHGDGVTCLAYTPDGGLLVSGGYDSCIRVWDVRSGREKVPTDDNRGRILVALSADGNRLATAGVNQPIRCWDANNGKETRSLDLGGDYASASVLLSPDGGRLTALTDKLLRSWDLDTGRELRRLYLRGDLRQGLLSPDGRAVVGRTAAANLFLYRVPEERPVPVPRGSEAVFRYGVSPDGSRAATLANSGEVRLLEAATGKEFRRFKVPSRVFHFAFTPDNGLLATLSVRSQKEQDTQRIGRWVTENGASLPPFQGDQGEPATLTVSPDGKTLATGDDNGVVRLWELATGKPRGVLKGHRGGIVALAFSGDGRRLASGSKDTTALLWDLTAAPGAEPTQAGALGDRQLDALWADLLSHDATAAYRAVWVLAACPGQSVPYLRTRLKPEVADAKRLAPLIRDLDHPSFERRQQAHAALASWSELAGPLLQKALQDSPSAEVRRHAADLLESMKSSAFVAGGERLRSWRALEALEASGVPAACAVLESLARGDEGARLTREAKLALARLRKRGLAAPAVD